MLVAGLCVGAAVFMVLAVRDLRKSVDANTAAIRTINPALVGQAAVGLRSLGETMPHLLSSFAGLQAMLKVFNQLVTNAGKEPAPDLSRTPMAPMPATTRTGTSSVVAAEENSSFSVYDEEKAAQRDTMDQARQQGYEVREDYAEPPAADQMVNAGEAQAEAIPAVPPASAPGVSF